LIYFAVISAIGGVFGVARVFAGGLPPQSPSAQQPPADWPPQAAPHSTETKMTVSQLVVSILNSLVSNVVSLFLSLGITRIGFNILSGKEFNVGMVFSQGRILLRAVGASILFTLMVALGMLLLIVPGIYLAVRYGQFLQAIVDRDLSISDAFAYSSAITTNNRWQLLGLYAMFFLISLAGMLACCVGLIYAIPVTWLAGLAAYRWMQYGHRALLDHPATGQPMLKAGV
jgi:uncharacterized membrane protein